jgi:hypothetical protein
MGEHEYNESAFVSGLGSQTAKLKHEIDKLRLKAEVASTDRIHLDSEDGKAYLDNLNTKSKLSKSGGSGGFHGQVEHSCASITEYIRTEYDGCEDEDKERLQEAVKKHFKELKEKNAPPKTGRGLKWENWKYIYDLFFKSLDRIADELKASFEDVGGRGDSGYFVWGGMRWRVIAAGHSPDPAPRPRRPARKPRVPRHTGGATHCNAWNHKPGCQCGWGGPTHGKTKPSEASEPPTPRRRKRRLPPAPQA